ncbi:dnaJ homolog subfamily C member 4 isoform X2 [Eleutherodactylus coqui]|uniref:J domain-containing protein n=1 Tax=Eleutherodactylus coqui TaxID=57060 RepID=A0A8J6K0X9_ELECQ|nr:hypothetical protein GDO78_003720 [Eleutherodactylus coqui]KAG9475461.1 hypothetical protein GDO78_003720 [Eleutherodactylus coqui]KAG9475462.1 hypothetical protein GDO78_003720 [Eleutherodactylus coqui]KAG9475463.1 hypothetical protein GDO78_003720 [Eleutherodactylus coqui]
MMLWRGLCKDGIQLCMVQAHRCTGTYSRSNLKDHYQVLGIGRKATNEEIKNAFFALSKKCHPDSDPTNPLLHSQFVRLNEAYSVLSKPSSREQYDQILEAIQRDDWRATSHNPYKSHSTTYNWKQTYQTREGPYTRSSSKDNSRYWSEFPPKSDWKDSAEDRKRRNNLIVFYCIFLGSLSIAVHLAMFSAVRDMRRKEREEQQKRILKFYNDRTEAARENGLHKQHEILLQRYEDRLRQLYGRKLEDETRK